MPITDAEINGLVTVYVDRRKEFELFLQGVSSAFSSSIALNTGVPTALHSLRSRLKGEKNLAEKIRRKDAEGKRIAEDNLFLEITDFAGLRVLHLHQSQFGIIHQFISEKIKKRIWKLLEKPIAYTWDPESQDYFRGLKIKTEVKPSYYTSVHYLVAPANDEGGSVCCEIQVRTLFEEAWGEIDHSINYPNPTTNVASVEQLRVLSKLVSTGSRLADAIFKVHGLGTVE
jgi:putative GTP pyrophosphokinase